MKQQLLDLIEHTVIACGAERVSICAEGAAHIPYEGAAHMHSYRSDKQVIIYGYFNTPPTDSYGIVDNGQLYSLLTNPNLSLVNQNKNLLTFENAKTGNSVAYSFLSKKRIAELLPSITPTSKLKFDAVAPVPDDFVEKLKKQKKIVGLDDYVVFKIESYINFRMEGWSDTVQGDILLPADYMNLYSWDIDLIIKIISQSGDYKLRVSSQGALRIECETEFAKYLYYLPALMK